MVTTLAVSMSACGSNSDDARGGDPTLALEIELRDETGPRVDDPDRAMAMTVDAVDIHGDDILVRLRVENRDDGYLDLGVQHTIYGPLLVMIDDRENTYESLAVEPAGIPGRRIADLSFRLIGPLDPDARAFTLELATQRGTLTSPPGELPHGDGARWRTDHPIAEPTAGAHDRSEPTFAAAPRLPDLIHRWLETDPIPDDH